MNYLAHAFLSFEDSEILTGNMIGDHVKGRLALDKFPEKIKKGIELHRKIDAYTDAHPATGRAKLFFRQQYGLYSGALMDALYDHFLANDPKIFSGDKALLEFTQGVYAKLHAHAAFFPPAFAQYFPYMEEQNWLYHYRTLLGVQRALDGLARRAKHLPPVDAAYKIFITHYYQLNQCYYELIDGIITFVKIELTK